MTEQNSACELKAPIRVRADEKRLGDIWFGFYWLADSSNVPGHTLPKNEVLLIVRFGPDFETTGDYIEPLAVRSGEKSLKAYKFPRGSRETFFFLSGTEAQQVFAAAEKADSVDILVDYPNGEARIFWVNTADSSGFPAYAEMLRACGRAIAG